LPRQHFYPFLGAQHFTPFCPAPPDYILSTSSVHPLHEAVHPLHFSVFWLVGTFHLLSTFLDELGLVFSF
jgi:hypothetical protein